MEGGGFTYAFGAAGAGAAGAEAAAGAVAAGAAAVAAVAGDDPAAAPFALEDSHALDDPASGGGDCGRRRVGDLFAAAAEFTMLCSCDSVEPDAFQSCLSVVQPPRGVMSALVDDLPLGLLRPASRGVARGVRRML